MAWQSGGGGGYPGVTGDGSIPPGLVILGEVQAGGNVITAASLASDALAFQTQPGGGLAVNKADDSFAGLDVRLTNGSSGAELRLSMADGGGIQRTVFVVNADGSISTVTGIGTNGVTPQSAPRTLAQSVITAITDANAKTAIQACADALADTGPLTIT